MIFRRQTNEKGTGKILEMQFSLFMSVISFLKELPSKSDKSTTGVYKFSFFFQYQGFTQLYHCTVLVVTGSLSRVKTDLVSPQ